MRIAKLELLAYGPFRGVEIDLSAPGLHLIFGRNEAGKSTTLRAIRGLLYGIDRKTRDDHTVQKELRVGGTLVSASGERVRIVRRKGSANTLMDEEGAPLDEDVVLRFLRGVSKETFEHAFALDHETLRRGAEGLLEGKGDLGESLFDASVGGGGSVQALLAELTQEADRIYRPRGSALPLNEALKAFAEAQKLVRERQSNPQAYLAQERALAEVEAKRGELAKHRAELGRRRAVLEDARRRAPLEARLARRREERAALGVLAERTELLASLEDRLRVYDAAEATRRQAVADAEHAALRVAEAARHAGVASAEDAPRIDARRKGRATALVAERSVEEAAVARTREEIARYEREIARLEPIAVDTTELARALDAARALGDAEARTERDTAALARRRRELESRAVSPGIFEGTLAERIALRVPDVEAVEHLAARAADVDKQLARLDDRLAKNAEEAANVARRIAEESGDFAPPTAADLAAARAARDRALATNAPDVLDLVRRADDVADRMIREADRVTSLARHRQVASHLAEERTALERDRREIAERRAALDEEHARLFHPLTPRSFGEMRRWLERHAQLVDEHAQLVAHEEELAARERDIEAVRRALSAALGREMLLPEMIAEASRRVTEAEQARRELAKLRARLADARDELATHEKQLEETKAKLVELTRPLGVPDDATGEEITSALTALGELFAAVDSRAASEARARAADAEVRAFEADVARLVAELAPDLADLPARDAARVLVDRRRKAEQNALDIAKDEKELEGLGEPGPHDLDVSDAAKEALDAEIDEADRELQALAGQIAALAAGFEKMRADSNAADAAADAHEALARIRSLVERYARAKIGAIVLAREIARYRDENQAPLLASASSLFSRLTLSAFSGVKAGFDDDDEPALVCIRSTGEEVRVEGLSEGTRDQLYLSLRLASLLRYADVREPLPLVLDDVLVHSDDERARAALVVLEEVARKMQVLLFTHHARVVDLARGALKELVVHELAQSGASLTPPMTALS